MGGDFNAWSQEWGSTRNDRRGDQLADWAASLNLQVGNVGNTSTYHRINAESVIDVTFYRTQAPSVLLSWRVLTNHESASDHRYIEFNLETLAEADDPAEPVRGWSIRQLDPVALATHLATTPPPDATQDSTADQVADLLTTYLEAACDACLPPRAPPRSGRRESHWWNSSIKTLRTDLHRLRRRYQRSGRKQGQFEQTEHLREQFKEKRKELRIAIREAQTKSWSDLCAAVDDDPWDFPTGS